MVIYVCMYDHMTDILATNPIYLSAVLGLLIFFGKGVCASCLFQERLDPTNCTFFVITGKGA